VRPEVLDIAITSISDMTNPGVTAADDMASPKNQKAQICGENSNEQNGLHAYKT
jgi:hypothetical protein